MRLPALLICLSLAVLFSGCAKLTTPHLADIEQQQQAVHEAERVRLWESNKDWLLARLPRAVEVAQQVIKALDGYPGNKEYTFAGV